MFDISVLKEMKLTELQDIAKLAKTIKIAGVKKEALIDLILKHQNTSESSQTPVNNSQETIDNKEFDLAITLYKTTVEEVKAVAENNLIMPPKSTWIEPKLRTGLIIYETE